MKFLTIIPLLYVCMVAGLYFAQRGMIYFPTKHKPDITPYAQVGIFEVTINTEDQLNLMGWMRSPEDREEIVVFFHGNASTLPMSVNAVSPYAERGYGFLLAEYRGYSGNIGKPTEKGFYHDARAWINFLLSKGYSEDQIILYGQSIGTGVAVQIATEFPNVKGVVLESPYTSLPDVAAKTYFFIPVHLLMKDKFDNYSKIKDVRAPLIILQGKNDRIIPPEFGQKLFAAANDPKELIRIEGYGHNDLPPDVLVAESLKFFNSLNKANPAP